MRSNSFDVKPKLERKQTSPKQIAQRQATRGPKQTGEMHCTGQNHGTTASGHHGWTVGSHGQAVVAPPLLGWFRFSATLRFPCNYASIFAEFFALNGE